MAEFTPDCPLGAVSFCWKWAPVDWFSIQRFLQTEKSRDDYAKFCYSFKDNYSSLVLSAMKEKEASFGWYSNDELNKLQGYYFKDFVRSYGRIRHDIPVHDTLVDVYSNWKSFCPPSGDGIMAEKFAREKDLYNLHNVHSYYAYRKIFAKCDYIKWNSDFDEMFQRLKSEKIFPELSDDILKFYLTQHFSLLRKLNDNLGMMGLLSVGSMPEGNRILDAINKEYSIQLGNTLKIQEERLIMKYVDRMEYKNILHKRLDQGRVLRTEYITQASPLTTHKMFELKDGAIDAISWIGKYFSRLKGRGWKNGGPGSGTGRVPGFCLVVLSVAILGIGHQRARG